MIGENILGCGSSHQYGFASLRAVHSSFRLKMLSWKRIVAFNLFTLFMAVCFWKYVMRKNALSLEDFKYCLKESEMLELPKCAQTKQ